METKLSSQQMLLDICSMRSRAIDLLTEGKNYNTLLATITEKDYYYDETIPLPSLKTLAGLTGLKYDLVRRQLKQIYEDLLPSYENQKLFQFQNVKYEFYIKGQNNSLFLDADSLPVVPRVGENIIVPFFKAYLGTDNFHVIEIQHTLFDKLQIIRIELKQGSYNLYWHFRKEKAEEEGELFWRDFYELDDYQLKKKLNIGKQW